MAYTRLERVNFTDGTYWTFNNSWEDSAFGQNRWQYGRVSVPVYGTVVNLISSKPNTDTHISKYLDNGSHIEYDIKVYLGILPGTYRYRIENFKIYNSDGQYVSLGGNPLDIKEDEAMSFAIAINEETNQGSVIEWGYNYTTTDPMWVNYSAWHSDYYNAFQYIASPPRESDYYEDNNGISGENGGYGSWNKDDYVNPVPDLPELDAVATGFLTEYIPSISQLNSLAGYMWSTNFLDELLKLFASPMDTILALNIIPTSLTGTGTKDVKVGNVSTGISMNYTNHQFYEFNLGSVIVREFFGSYLDYAPYTKIEIYLPFIGVRRIEPDVVMNKTLGIVYHIDSLSGACVAYITVNGSVYYTFTGDCATPIPITNESFSRTIQSMTAMVTSVAASVASSGASIPVAATMGSVISTVESSKPDIEKSGNIGGSVSLLCERTPYLIFTRPSLCTPADQPHYTGYPAFITMQLSSCSGFTRVSEIHLENISGATTAELSEIEALLKGGVIF